jgi:hypothetical protein
MQENGIAISLQRFCIRRSAPAIIFLGIVVLATNTGCKPKREDLMVWKAQSPSPDGRWIATADTVQNGGFGSADIYTTVHLKRTGDTSAPVDVLGIDSQEPIPRPYVLDNVANKGGSIGLTMEWETPTRLRVTYIDQACTVVMLQMTTYAEVAISLQSVGKHPPC